MKTKFPVFAFSAILLLVGCADKSAQKPYYCEIEFELIRTFHSPIKITVTGGVEDSSAELKAEIYSGAGGYDWGEVERVIEKEISTEIFLDLYKEISELDFNQLFDSEGDPCGVDGSTWRLSLQRSSSISLSIWSPTGDTEERGLNEFVSVGTTLLSLSEIKIPEEELY